jgi:hypothetical protein
MPDAPLQPPPALPSDRLITPQTIIALVAMAIVAVIVAKVLWNGNEQLQGQVLVIASGSMGTLLAFYFGSSKGSADKDAKPVPPPVVVAPVATMLPATADATPPPPGATP